MRARDPIPGLRQKLRVKLKEMGVTGKFSTDLRRNAGNLVLVVKLEEYKQLYLPMFEGYPVLIGMPHQWQAVIDAFNAGRPIQHRCMGNDHHPPTEWYQWEDADLSHINNSYFEWRIKEQK